jgi:hypothetical protein
MRGPDSLRQRQVVARAPLRHAHDGLEHAARSTGQREAPGGGGHDDDEACSRNVEDGCLSQTMNREARIIRFCFRGCFYR